MDRLGRYLEENQPFIDSVFSTVQDGIFILDRDDTIVRANAWMESKYTLKMPPALRKCYRVLRDRQTACPTCQQRSSRKDPQAHVEILPYPSAHAPTGWFEVSLSQLRDVDGTVVGAMGHVKDVTDRNQAVALLKDEINRRRILVEQSRDGIVVLDQNGRVFEANQEFAHMLGYSLEDVQRLCVWDWDAQWNQAELKAMLQSVDNTGDHFETRHRRKDGTLYDVEISTNGAVYRGQKLIFCICRDITERISEKKRIEETLRLTQFSFDKASIGIFRTRQDAQILNANEQACKSLGYRLEELCKMNFQDIDPSLSPQERQARWQHLCRTGDITYQSVHRRKDGSEFPVDVTANLLAFEGNRYAISFVRDITAQVDDAKQKAMLEAHLRQAQRMEALGTLAGGIAHDFNNILSGIFGYTGLAQLRCAENSKLRRYIDQIFEASVRAKNLVQQILTFSRQGKTVKRSIDIGRVVNEAMVLIRATVPATIDIKTSIQADLGDIFADEMQIHQIVVNLCTNAYHSMQTDGGLLEVGLVPVTIGAYDSSSYPVISPGKYIKLTIADTGHGMDRSTLSRIFDPYFTTRKSGEGTGMGLSIVHGIVRDHGGSTKVYSRQGVGTTIQVFLPLAETAPEQSDHKSGIFSSGGGFILFVDDEKQLIDIGSDLLEGLGYLVDTQTSPLDAIDALRVSPDKYDLVITDLTMPKMTGAKLAREIRKIRPDIPIILCTGHGGNLNGDSLKEVGIHEVLLKPITLSHLSATVRKILGTPGQ